MTLRQVLLAKGVPSFAMTLLGLMPVGDLKSIPQKLKAKGLDVADLDMVTLVINAVTESFPGNVKVGTLLDSQEVFNTVNSVLGGKLSPKTKKRKTKGVTYGN